MQEGQFSGLRLGDHRQQNLFLELVPGEGNARMGQDILTEQLLQHFSGIAAVRVTSLTQKKKPAVPYFTCNNFDI